MIEFKGHRIKSTVDELVMADFDKMNVVMSDNSLERFEKWIELFVYFGVDASIFDEVELHELVELVKDWNSSYKIGNRVMSYEHDGFTYECKGTISVKDLSLIEKAWKNNLKHFGSETVAILFKRTDLTPSEHKDNAHIKHKSKLFKSMPCSVGVPHVIHALEQVSNNLADAIPTEIVEGSDSSPME